MRLGIDIGSTTVKLVAIDENNDIRYSRYERHLSNVFEKVDELIREMYAELGDVPLKTVITGSGGLSLAKLRSADHSARKPRNGPAACWRPL